MSNVRKFGLISDTHGSIHVDVFEHFKGVETILHAGDVVDPTTLHELEAIAPVFAIAGNCDIVSPLLPLKRIVDLPFGKVGMAHGHEYPAENLTSALTQSVKGNLSSGSL